MVTVEKELLAVEQCIELRNMQERLSQLGTYVNEGPVAEFLFDARDNIEHALNIAAGVESLFDEAT